MECLPTIKCRQLANFFGPLLVCLLLKTSLFFPGLAEAQEEESEYPKELAPDDQLVERTLVNENIFVTARAAMMAGAIAPVADGLDAAWYNPAGIGGSQWGKFNDFPSVRRMYFPHAAGSANKNSQKLYNEFKKNGSTRDSGIANETFADYAGERLYARSSLVLGLVFGRVMIVPFADKQIAAVGRDADGEQGVLDAKYRGLTGVGTGFSLSSPEGWFSAGVFSYSATRTDSFITDHFTTIGKNLETFAESNSAQGTNIGVNQQLGKLAQPTLSFSIQNVGGTEIGDDQIDQSSIVGFSVSPRLGKKVVLNNVLQLNSLEDNETSIAKKVAIGMELNVGDKPNSFGLLSLRAGYNHAGGAGGIRLNPGIINFEVGVFGVDLGVGNKKLVDRRIVASAGVNVADF